MHAGRKHFDVLTVSEQTAKKPFSYRATTNITGTNKEDAFHVSDGTSERHLNLKANRSKSIKAMAVVSVVLSVSGFALPRKSARIAL
jgi:hypothetical protein